MISDANPSRDSPVPSDVIPLFITFLRGCAPNAYICRRNIALTRQRVSIQEFILTDRTKHVMRIFQAELAIKSFLFVYVVFFTYLTLAVCQPLSCRMEFVEFEREINQKNQ